MNRTVIVGLLFAQIWSCQLPPQQVFLRNAETGSVSFAVSCDDRHSWLQATLAASEGRRFACSERNAKMWVHVNSDIPGTPHAESETALQNGSRYELYFDQTRKKWDVRPLGMPSS